MKRGRPAKAAITKNKAKKDSGVETATPAAADEDEDVCPICLDPPVLPVQLECSHQFCFTCAKGLAMENPEDGPGCCSLCRAPIPPGFFREAIQYIFRIMKSLKISPKKSSQRIRDECKQIKSRSKYLSNGLSISRPELLQRTRSDLASSAADNNNWQWFYQGGDSIENILA